MDDGIKTPKWDDTLITIPRRLLQECAMALSTTRGLVQRLESHHSCDYGLDARDKRALEWGYEAYKNLLDSGHV